MLPPFLRPPRRAITNPKKLKPVNSINVCRMVFKNYREVENFLEGLPNGEKFDAVSRELSEDKTF